MAVALAFVMAERSARAAAFLIDVALRVAPFCALGGAGYFAGSRSLMRVSLVLSAIGLVLLTCVDGWGLATRGQTLGKRLMRVRIVRADGTGASASRVLILRTIVPLIVAVAPYFGLMWLILDHLWILGASRRAAHDLLADTIVVSLPAS